jgi:uncharacterized protein YdcH (DUF465 family)
MELADPEVREILLAENDSFRDLAARHAEFEARLAELTGKALPSEQERIEEIEIKKRKLLLKDRMAAMIRDYRRDKLVSVA